MLQIDTQNIGVVRVYFKAHMQADDSATTVDLVSNGAYAYACNLTSIHAWTFGATPREGPWPLGQHQGSPAAGSPHPWKYPSCFRLCVYLCDVLLMVQRVQREALYLTLYYVYIFFESCTEIDIDLEIETQGYLHSSMVARERERERVSDANTLVPSRPYLYLL
jgi:hypothetical protein